MGFNGEKNGFLPRLLYAAKNKGITEEGYQDWRESKRTASQSLAAPAGDNTQPKPLGEPASPYRGGYTDSDGGDGLGSTPSGKRKRASQMLGG